MSANDPQRLLNEVLATARAINATASEDGEWDAMWRALCSLRPLGRKAFDRALTLLKGDNWDRSLGCDLLGVLCAPDDEGWSHEAALALVAAARSETDPEVLQSLAGALNNVADPLGVPVLSELAGHPDEDVRLAVAGSIPSCRSYEDEEDTAPIVHVLLRLMVDDDAGVRNWATFGLGQQMDDDSATIREALVARLRDPDHDARWEAIIGLARRHDRRAFEPLREALAGGGVPLHGVRAASWLADARLLDSLQALTDDDQLSEEVLEAIRRCDQNLAEHRVLAMTEFLEKLYRAAERSHPGLVASFSCPRLENRVELTLAIDGQELQLAWDAEFLLERKCAGDSDEAALAVLADLPQ